MKRVFIVVLTLLWMGGAAHSETFEDRCQRLIESSLGGVFRYESSNIDESGFICVTASVVEDPQSKVILWTTPAADHLVIGSVYDGQGRDLTVERYKKMVGPLPYTPQPLGADGIEPMMRNMQIMGAASQKAATHQEKIENLWDIRAMFDDPGDFDALYDQVRARAEREAATSDRVAARKVSDERFLSLLRDERIGLVDPYGIQDPLNTVYIFSTTACPMAGKARAALDSNIDLLKNSRVAVKWIMIAPGATERELKEASLVIEKGFHPDPAVRHVIPEETVQKAVFNTAFYREAFDSDFVPIVVWRGKGGVASILGFPEDRFVEPFIETVREKGNIRDFIFESYRKLTAERG